MKPTVFHRCAGILLLSASAVVLAACSAADRIADIGEPPKMAPIVNPVAQPGYKPVSIPLDQMPDSREANSLWVTGSRSFFHDPRASHVGDIITIEISVADAAKLSDTTSRSRTNSDDANLTNFFGLESDLANALPQAADPSSLVKMGSDTSNVGAGSINRSEAINTTLAGIVTQVLPNGNMVIEGHQQVRVNYEMRDLRIAGIVRTEDITSNNTINLEQIAEARVSYGGQGQITDVQQPRYGSQLFDILMPF
ncbi:MAG TPA: flagellar basal body L-ring protein FlgH [Rhizomicrobium sp.]|jgi:flagellar L-ring protein precursor FlgH|nr:flagellar basal body L-ring protein FlgH [Rhizomicrobium sp.]HEX4533932.1 flagellar basal body L-ring protein FlgH [Rhizomicrobium sp.]